MNLIRRFFVTVVASLTLIGLAFTLPVVLRKALVVLRTRRA